VFHSLVEQLAWGSGGEEVTKEVTCQSLDRCLEFAQVERKKSVTSRRDSLYRSMPHIWLPERLGWVWGCGGMVVWLDHKGTEDSLSTWLSSFQG
jgi:hypothetical protein